jgi:CheY-like chemotaxis protein
LVEDDDLHAELTSAALGQASIPVHVEVAEDGDRALNSLSEHAAAGRHRAVDLILLDLNLPKRSGHEVLVELKNDERFKRIPVVVVSSSTHERDVTGAYDEGANAYVTKSSDYVDFTEKTRTMCEFWAKVAVLSER